MRVEFRRSVVLCVLVLGTLVALASGQNAPYPDGVANSKAPRLTDEQKIESLIRAVAQLRDATFIRNDEAHEGAEAAAHMRRKWTAEKDKIRTAADFIVLAGSVSSQSGQPYKIRFKDGREITSAEFLKAELRKVEAGSFPEASAPVTASPSTQPTSRPATSPAPTPAPAAPGVSPGDPANPPAPDFNLAESDPRAIELADLTVKTMGGRAAWDQTRYLTWNFFGGRRHVWDKLTGQVRIDMDDVKLGSGHIVVVQNLNTREGTAWRDGQEITDQLERPSLLKAAYSAFINDSYWMFMPYKLKDSGVTLKYRGELDMLDGRPAHVISLTFKAVGLTPNNKYDVYVAKDTGLVEQWGYYPDATDPEPKRTFPWTNWQRYGRILLSDGRGAQNGKAMRMTDIAVFDELPESIFTSPHDVDLMALSKQQQKAADEKKAAQPEGPTRKP